MMSPESIVVKINVMWPRPVLLTYGWYGNGIINIRLQKTL
jgi:hypothetical protein